MKRFVVAVFATIGLVAAAATLPAQGAASGPKPPKLDPPTLDGGQPYPLGLAGKYGVLQVSFPTPAASFAITGYTVTCTPKYFKPPAVNSLPTTPIVVTVTLGPPVVVTSTGGDPAVSPGDYSATGGLTPTTKIKVRELQAGADTTYPARSCSITTTNAQGSKAGKATKIGLASTPNCSLIPQPDQSPPDLVTDPKKPVLMAGVEVTSLQNLLFCSTDSATAKADWSSDQSVVFGGKSKFKRDKKSLIDIDGGGPLAPFKCATGNPKAVPPIPGQPLACPSFALVKKLGLVSGVNTALTLVISGTVLKYEYDATAVHVTSCVLTKPAATDNCTFAEAGGVGTITLTSSAENIIKPGKKIKSPTIDVTFDTTNAPATTYPVWFKSATTTISIGTNVVDILLKSLPQVISEQQNGGLVNTYGCTSGPFPPVGCSNPNPSLYLTDLNYGPSAPVASFTVTPL